MSKEIPLNIKFLGDNSPVDDITEWSFVLTKGNGIDGIKNISTLLNNDILPLIKYEKDQLKQELLLSQENHINELKQELLLSQENHINELKQEVSFNQKELLRYILEGQIGNIVLLPDNNTDLVIDDGMFIKLKMRGLINNQTPLHDHNLYPLLATKFNIKAPFALPSLPSVLMSNNSDNNQYIPIFYISTYYIIAGISKKMIQYLE